MTAENFWQLFLETGAPEMYLLYQRALKTEESHVSDHPSCGTPGYGLQ